MNWKTGFKISPKTSKINSTISLKILWPILMSLLRLNRNTLTNKRSYSWNLHKMKYYYQTTNRGIAKAMIKTNKV